MSTGDIRRGWSAKRAASTPPSPLAAGLGGASFHSVYLLVLSLRAKGDMREVLLGERRAGA